MKNLIKQKLRESYDNNILYCAVVLDEESHNILLSKIGVPEGWKPFAHHMTIQFGKSLADLNINDDEFKNVTLTVTHRGVSNKALAVRVEGYHSNNKIPHITVAVNVNDGGKPVMSNDISNWVEIERFQITGVVKNVLK